MKSKEFACERMETLTGTVDTDGGVGRVFDLSDEYELLGVLKPEQRKALLLVYGYGWTYKQLASLQKISIGAVKTQIHRAKKKLQAVASEMAY